MIVNFVCRKSKVRSNGTAPIELSVIINGRRKYVALDRKINPKSFIAKKQMVKGDESLNEYLNAVRNKCYSIETEMIKYHMLFNTDTFTHAFKYGLKSNAISVNGLFDEFLKKQEAKYDGRLITGAVVSKYKCTIRYCREAMDGDKMLADLSTSDVEAIYMYMLGKMANNSAICYMRKLKTMLIYAIQEGYINTNPVTFKFHKDKVETEPLTLEEIRAIRAKEFPTERLNNIRDMFILQCYTGLAFKDMSSLTAKDIKVDKDGKEWIMKARTKTGVTAFIPVLPVVKEILERHHYLLPTPSNQKYNAYLKEIQEVCGIQKTLHSHLARHTCGTILLNAGLDMVSVSRILGHSSSKITESVYAKLLPTTIMERVEAVSDKLE